MSFGLFPLAQAARPVITQFTVSPSTASAGQSVSVTLSATDADGDMSNYAVRHVGFGGINPGGIGASTGNGSSFSVTFSYTVPSSAGAGQHILRGEVADANFIPGDPNSIALQDIYLTVQSPNAAPSVSLSPSNSSPVSGETVTFTANASDSDGSIANVKIYRDGSLMVTDTSYPYQYSYADAGTGSHYFVAVATDDDGATANTSNLWISWSAPPPPPPFNITVTGSTSGSVWGTDIYTDDSAAGKVAVHMGFVVPGQQATVRIVPLGPQSSYSGSTRYGVTTYSYGYWGGSFEMELIQAYALPNVPPEASISAGPTSGTAYLPVSFSASGSYDPDGSISTYAWDFDDNGSIDAYGYSASHTYTSGGSYTARLNVMDNSNDWATATQTISVTANTPPTATLSASPSSPQPGQTVAVSATYTDPNSGQNVLATVRFLGVGPSYANSSASGTFTVLAGPGAQVLPGSGSLGGSYQIPTNAQHGDVYWFRTETNDQNGGGDMKWASATVNIPAPSVPSAPSPGSGSGGVSSAPALSWSASGATSYDVYFGTDSTPDSTEFKGNQASASYSPGSLSGSTTYYWQIVAKNSGGETWGPVWSFTTANTVAIDVEIDSGISPGPDYYELSLMGFQASVTDPESKVAKVGFSVDGGPELEDATPPFGIYLPDPQAGSRYIRARALNSAGSEEASDTVYFNVQSISGLPDITSVYWDDANGDGIYDRVVDTVLNDYSSLDFYGGNPNSLYQSGNLTGRMSFKMFPQPYYGCYADLDFWFEPFFFSDGGFSLGWDGSWSFSWGVSCYVQLDFLYAHVVWPTEIGKYYKIQTKVFTNDPWEDVTTTLSNGQTVVPIFEGYGGDWDWPVGKWKSLFQIALLARVVELANDAGENPPAPVNVGDVDGDGIDDYEKVLAPNVKGIIPGTGGPLSKIFNLEIPAGVLVNPTGGNLIEIKYRKLGDVIWQALGEYVVTGEVSYPISIDVPGLASDRFEVQLSFKSNRRKAQSAPILLNDDDDDGNVVDRYQEDAIPSNRADDELVKLRNPHYKKKNGQVRVELVYASGGGEVRLWHGDRKGAPANLGNVEGVRATWSALDDPEEIYIEGTKVSSAKDDVKIRWGYQPEGQSDWETVEDSTTVVQVSIESMPDVSMVGGESSAQVRVTPSGVDVSVRLEASPSSKASVSFGGSSGSQITKILNGISDVKIVGLERSGTANDVQVVVTPQIEGSVTAGAGQTAFPIQASGSTTVYGVESVEWVESYAGQFDANPNAGGGLRLFPGKQNPNDAVNRRLVMMKAKVMPIRQNLDVRFYVVDVDDPSAHGGPVDVNTNGKDNRDEGSLSFGPFVASTNAQSVAEGTQFTVGMQPGNNYRVVAFLAPGVEAALSADQSNHATANVKAGGSVVVSGPGSPYAVSEMLTVWRKMHIEVDSMGPVAGNGISGTITQVSSPALGPWRRVETGLAYVDSDNRFEGGQFVTEGKTYEIADNSGAANLRFGIKKDDPSNPTEPLVSKSFVATDDDLLQDGQDVPEPDTSYIAMAFEPAYVEPAFDGGGNPANNNGNVAFGANFDSSSPAPIVAQINLGRQAPKGAADFWVIYLQGAHQGVLTGDGDPDSETNIEMGMTANAQLTASSGEGSLIYIESIAEYNRHNPQLQQPESWIVAHEIGHLFDGLDVHRTNTGSLMDDGGKVTNPHFDDVSLAAVRKTFVP